MVDSRSGTRNVQYDPVTSVIGRGCINYQNWGTMKDSERTQEPTWKAPPLVKDKTIWAPTRIVTAIYWHIKCLIYWIYNNKNFKN